MFTDPYACRCGHEPQHHPCVVLGCDCRSHTRVLGSDAALSNAEANLSAPSDVATHAKRETTPQRERLPSERASYTRVFRLRYEKQDGSPATMQFYFTAGVYPDGRVGEVFVTADKGGTLVRGALDMIGVLTSLLLQHGVPLQSVVDKMKGTRFPPASFTGDAEIPNCTSPLDLLAKWLEHKFLPKEQL